MDFLSIIGTLTLVGGILYLSTVFNEHRADNIYECERLIEEGHLFCEFNAFRNSHPEMSYEKALKTFFTFERKVLIKKQIAERKERIALLNKKETERHIRMRVFAYEYENFVFSLFDSHISQYEERNYYNLIKIKIKREIIIDEIKKYYGLNDNQALDLFEKLNKNDIISRHYILNENNYNIGSTLTIYANVISEDDLNYEKWVIKNS